MVTISSSIGFANLILSQYSRRLLDHKLKIKHNKLQVQQPVSLKSAIHAGLFLAPEGMCYSFSCDVDELSASAGFRTSFFDCNYTIMYNCMWLFILIVIRICLNSFFRFTFIPWPDWFLIKDSVTADYNLFSLGILENISSISSTEKSHRSVKVFGRHCNPTFIYQSFDNNSYIDREKSPELPLKENKM